MSFHILLESLLSMTLEILELQNHLIIHSVCMLSSGCIPPRMYKEITVLKEMGMVNYCVLE